MEILNSMSGYALAFILFLALIVAYIELMKKDKYIEYLESEALNSIEISNKPVIIPQKLKSKNKNKNKVRIFVDKDFIKIYPNKE